MDRFITSNLILIISSALGYLFIMAGITGIQIFIGDFEIRPAKERKTKILYVLTGFLFIFVPLMLDGLLSGESVIERGVYSAIF